MLISIMSLSTHFLCNSCIFWNHKMNQFYLSHIADPSQWSFSSAHYTFVLLLSLLLGREVALMKILVQHNHCQSVYPAMGKETKCSNPSLAYTENNGMAFLQKSVSNSIFLILPCIHSSWAFYHHHLTRTDFSQGRQWPSCCKSNSSQPSS